MPWWRPRRQRQVRAGRWCPKTASRASGQNVDAHAWPCAPRLAADQWSCFGSTCAQRQQRKLEPEAAGLVGILFF
eukprot:8216058-Pyramimonas_sp.AAC.1